jgi:hypothetical protein
MTNPTFCCGVQLKKTVLCSSLDGVQLKMAKEKLRADHFFKLLDSVQFIKILSVHIKFLIKLCTLYSETFVNLKISALFSCR